MYVELGTPDLDERMARPNEQATGPSLLHPGQVMGPPRLGSGSGKGVPRGLEKVSARDRPQIQEALCNRDQRKSAQTGLFRYQALVYLSLESDCPITSSALDLFL